MSSVETLMTVLIMTLRLFLWQVFWRCRRKKLKWQFSLRGKYLDRWPGIESWTRVHKAQLYSQYVILSPRFSFYGYPVFPLKHLQRWSSSRAELLYLFSFYCRAICLREDEKWRWLDIWEQNMSEALQLTAPLSLSSHNTQDVVIHFLQHKCISSSYWCIMCIWCNVYSDIDDSEAYPHLLLLCMNGPALVIISSRYRFSFHHLSRDSVLSSLGCWNNFTTTNISRMIG